MNFVRQLDLFNPDKFSHPMHVIGAGAIGSYIALNLAKLTGSPEITVWDHDEVEEHNLPNQLFGPEDVGKPKVEALEQLVNRLTGIRINAEHRRCTGDCILRGVVFLAVDSMDTRKEIFEGAIKANPNVQLMVEVRLGIEFGLIYAIDPNNMGHLKRWEADYYPDSNGQESPCTNRMICTTVTTIAGLATHRMITWNRGNRPTSKMIVDLSSDSFEAERWWKVSAPDEIKMDESDYAVTSPF